MLSTEEQARYKRQVILDEVGQLGQLRLKAAKVLCVGAGGLGSSLCLYLAASGIGHLGIVDGDTISLSNLHRQILYRTSECGLSKTIQAKLHLESLNPHCQVDLHREFLTEDNALEIIKHYDIVVDGSDNFSTKYLINDVCYTLKKPFVLASVQQYCGYCTVFSGENGPCYRCLFEAPPSEHLPNCSQAGVLGIVPGIIGLYQANEVIKLILDIGESLVGKMLIFDALSASTKHIHLKISPDCILCEKKVSYQELPRYNYDNVKQYGITAEAFHRIQVSKEKFTLIDVRSEEEFQAKHLDAINIPIAALLYYVDKTDKDATIILYCQSDQRSQRACQQLRTAGFNAVFFIEGGLDGLSQLQINE